MVDRDFAQIKAPMPEGGRPMGQMRVLLLTLLALIVVAGGFAAGFFTGQKIGVEKATSESEARLVAQLKQQQEELAKLRAEAKNRQPEVSTTQVGELTFYNELPRQSVEPEPLQAEISAGGQSAVSSREPETEKPLATSTSLQQVIEQELQLGADRKSSDVSEASAGNSVKTVTSAGEYYLQVASFQKQTDAEKFMPKLNQAGLSGVIRRVELSGLGTWYRVYAGPFSSKQASEEAKRTVKSRLNITGLIIKGG